MDSHSAISAQQAAVRNGTLAFHGSFEWKALRQRYCDENTGQKSGSSGRETVSESAARRIHPVDALAADF
jgi:hypothetical protein